MVDNLTIPINLIDGKTITIEIASHSPASLFKISEEEAYTNGESPYQLVEGYLYDYKLSSGYSLEKSDIVSQLKFDNALGRLQPNIYVGTVFISVLDNLNYKCGELRLEVRSSKTSYRDDYRWMLADIAEKCVELIISHNSPTTQLLTIDFEKDASLLYQRFAFIKSIIETEEFKESISRIVSSPVTSWEVIEMQTDVRATRRLDHRSLRQFATNGNRLLVVSGDLTRTMPRTIRIRKKTTTVDCAENRFIKHALDSFLSVCSELAAKAPIASRLSRDASLLEQNISNLLNHDVFKELSPANTIPLNSPVLQRKEGYREVFRTWLLFDLAAKLIWQGGEDVYNGGKRDIAVLYEYWIFFKLLDVIKEVFDVESKDIKELIQPTKDGLALQLRQGKHLPISAVYNGSTRKLNIQFSYNRTFPGDRSYPSGGSWTRDLRPDYTLSIWAFGISQDQAESEELITHLHFDAKYKIDNITSIFQSPENLDNEKIDQRKGAYKRADLLKMHTYRDAIRRTVGSYILYPGNEELVKVGYHELLPGIGAFAVRPSRTDSGQDRLKVFLSDVLAHFLNRASQREVFAFQTYNIHKEKRQDNVNELLPEPFGQNRGLLPTETYVLVGYYRSQRHYEWILSNRQYNARVQNTSDDLVLRIEPTDVAPRYILLYTGSDPITGKIFRVLDRPSIVPAGHLQALHYPSKPSSEYYLVYPLDPTIADEFQGRTWNVSKLKSGMGRKGLPFTVTLFDLFNSADTNSVE